MTRNPPFVELLCEIASNPTSCDAGSGEKLTALVDRLSPHALKKTGTRSRISYLPAAHQFVHLLTQEPPSALYPRGETLLPVALRRILITPGRHPDPLPAGTLRVRSPQRRCCGIA